MVTIIAEVSKYIIIILCAIYTLSCFTIFKPSNKWRQEKLLNKQVLYLFVLHFVCYLVLFIRLEEFKIILFYGAQALFIALVQFFYQYLYPKASRLITNNMCFLLTIGFTILTRLSFDLAVKQFVIVTVSIILASFIPMILMKFKRIHIYGSLFGVTGLILLSSVFIFGTKIYGATNWIKIGRIAFQPSEFVKIIFIFFIASMLAKSTGFRQILITTIMAAIHVIVLVLEKDLGAALLFFIIYLVMLYVASGKAYYFIGGLAGGSLAAYVAFNLFSHVQTRVEAWKNPWKIIDSGGYQITQSLFAIGTGGWLGMGLAKGMPNSIPVVESDFVFSAIAEELGTIFALCLILICVSCFVIFLDIAMRNTRMFYKLLALGFGICYIFQVFLSIGGVTKFIPSTGVTLPLVSYGGSSVVSSIMIFNIIQSLYMIAGREADNSAKK